MIPPSLTAQAPEVCQRFPLSVGLFLIPSFHARLKTSLNSPGLRTCRKEDMPRPHLAYTVRSSSTTTSTGLVSPTPPTSASHFDVCSSEEWDTAMNLTSRYLPAASRSRRKVFSATCVISSESGHAAGVVDTHGQPQCRRKAITVGLESERGNGTCDVVGAACPNSGDAEIGP